MMVSSRTCCERRRGLELAAVAEQCPDDVGQDQPAAPALRMSGATSYDPHNDPSGN